MAAQLAQLPVDLGTMREWSSPASGDRLIYPQSDGVLFLESFGPKGDSDAPQLILKDHDGCNLFISKFNEQRLVVDLDE
jgi:hypothetical protein